MNFREFKAYCEFIGVIEDTELGFRDMNFGGEDTRYNFDRHSFDLEGGKLLFSSVLWEPCD